MPTVPEPMNSPGIRVSSLVTWAMISSNENSMPSDHALRAHLAVDARFHLQFVGIADLVRRDDPRPHHVAAVKALAFRRPEPPFHFDALGIARGKVVEDGIAEDVVPGLGGGDVGALVLGDDAELEFVVHHLAVARPLHRGVGAAHAEKRLVM